MLPHRCCYRKYPKTPVRTSTVQSSDSERELAPRSGGCSNKFFGCSLSPQCRPQGLDTWASSETSMGSLNLSWNKRYLSHLAPYLKQSTLFPGNFIQMESEPTENGFSSEINTSLRDILLNKYLFKRYFITASKAMSEEVEVLDLY